jgi:glycosidase
MNYRWYRIARGFFAQAEPKLKPSEFANEIQRINKDIRPGHLQAMMNVAASHDSPRLSTSLFNKSMYKHHAKPSDNPEYKIHKPGTATRQEQKLLLINQFTFPGAPHIWNGDEVGMWGADDPDCRKPMVWDDLNYEVEKSHYFEGKSRPADTVQVDTVMLNFYKNLIRLRKQYPVLANGKLEVLLANDSDSTLAYKRSNGGENIIIAFNLGQISKDAIVPVEPGNHYVSLFPRKGVMFEAMEKNITIPLGAKRAIVLKQQHNRMD